MKTSLKRRLAAALVMLLSVSAFAGMDANAQALPDAFAAHDAEAIPGAFNAPDPLAMHAGRVAPVVVPTGVPSVAAVTHGALLWLDETALDAIDAGGFGAAAHGVASADRGRALSVSTTQLVSSRVVTVALSQSLALAIGMHPVAATGAVAGTGGSASGGGTRH